MKSIIPPQRTTSICKKPSSSPINGDGEYSEPILPTDLITEILLRSPAKFIARFRCVSKLWASTLHHSYFTELFLTRSSYRPQVLFAFRKWDNLLFFSIPQPQNHDEKLSHVVATFLRKTPCRDYCGSSLGHSNGLVVLTKYWKSRSSNGFGVICNPSTGQSLSIPNLTWRSKYFLGYDPIEKQYKLLSVNFPSYKVLTLGSQKLLWRDMLCSREHYPLSYGICINGVLYYRASVHNPLFNFESIETTTMVVCFDIRSEEFQFMNVTENFRKAMKIGSKLINYNGKLGSLFHCIDERSETFEIWVLEDRKKHEWSKQIHVFPPLWKDVSIKYRSSTVGMIGTDEIIALLPSYENDSLYLIYYNLKKKSVAKVEIQGIKGCKGCRVLTFLNHVEDLKLLY